MRLPAVPSLLLVLLACGCVAPCRVVAALGFVRPWLLRACACVRACVRACLSLRLWLACAPVSAGLVLFVLGFGPGGLLLIKTSGSSILWLRHFVSKGACDLASLFWGPRTTSFRTATFLFLALKSLVVSASSNWRRFCRSCGFGVLSLRGRAIWRLCSGGQEQLHLGPEPFCSWL